MMHDNYNEDFGWDEYEDNDQAFEPNYSNYQHHRYGNAYGNYRGGYDRCNQGLLMQDFGPPGPPYGFQGPHFGPPGPPFRMTWKRGYDAPPRSIMQHKTVKYLLRCGVAKENLKNIPLPLLHMMEPEHCGICSKTFENYQVSRIHYTSKNHLKHQRKWGNQNAHMMSQRGPEFVPLKSRELYCELCDVHITSKEHAESHYSGKNHRAIVEGRKNPRNPLLLQRNMYDRLKQVIRREKKYMTPTEETPKPLKRAKTTSSELYCDICKTTMTCSEQMTSHMNGKRHLNKEKQHILKLMKGEGQAGNEGNPPKLEDDGEDFVEDGNEDDNEGEGDEESGEGEKEEGVVKGDEWGTDETWNESAETPSVQESS